MTGMVFRRISIVFANEAIVELKFVGMTGGDFALRLELSLALALGGFRPIAKCRIWPSVGDLLCQGAMLDSSSARSMVTGNGAAMTRLEDGRTMAYEHFRGLEGPSLAPMGAVRQFGLLPSVLTSIALVPAPSFLAEELFGLPSNCRQILWLNDW